jgi:hypothetical protein
LSSLPSPAHLLPPLLLLPLLPYADSLWPYCLPARLLPPLLLLLLLLLLPHADSLCLDCLPLPSAAASAAASAASCRLAVSPPPSPTHLLPPQVREVIHDFHNSRYATCFAALEALRPVIACDIHLHDHATTLYRCV